MVVFVAPASSALVSQLVKRDYEANRSKIEVKKRADQRRAVSNPETEQIRHDQPASN